MNKKVKVNCPKCKKKFEYYSSTFRPFCSERCKKIDLGLWFSESYQIEGKDKSLYIEDPEAAEKLLKGEDENN